MGAYFLFPVYYAIFQGLEGIGLIVAFRVYRRYYADLHLAPESRITYNKFDEDIDADIGSEGRIGGESDFYQRDSSDNSNYGDMKASDGLPMSTSNDGQAVLRKEPKMNDKTSLIPQHNQDDQYAYGGIR